MDQKDRRVNKIELTEKALALEEKVTKIAIDFMNDAIKGIDTQDLGNFVNVMRQIKDNLEGENN